MDGLFPGLESLDVNPVHPPSGFASGIRIIRDIEDGLCFYMRDTVEHSLAGMNKLRFRVYKYLIQSDYRDSGFAKWQANLPANEHPRIVPPYSDFIGHFSVADPGDSALVLIGQKQQGKSVQAETQNPRKKKAVIEYPSFSEEKLNQAQELIYDAWEAPNRQKCLSLARKALRISPYCADAYNLLAEECKSTEERQEFYEQGVKFGRMALGDLFFKKYTGHFWGLHQTRPYMRALAGFSECLWRNGRCREAIQNYQELLRLNPNDNQGIRYTLVNCLLAQGMDAEAAKLLLEYPESCCFMLYSQALLSFRSSDCVKSARYLKQALESNPHVPAYLLGIKHMPWRLPDAYAWGSEEEAVIYAADAGEVWKNTPGALAWLAEETRS